MTDEEVIYLAKKEGFKFHKQPNSWNWSCIAPNGNVCHIEQGDPRGMKFVRTELGLHILSK